MGRDLTGEGGKGSRQRRTDPKKFNDNWDKIFKNKSKDKKEDKR